MPASLKIPTDCNIGLKDSPDGILNDGKENPIKAITGDHVKFKLEMQRYFLSNRLSLSL